MTTIDPSKKFLVLDFEAYDPYLAEAIDLGPGWVFKLKVPTALSYAIGFSYCYIENNTVTTAFYKPIAAPATQEQQQKNLDLLKQIVLDKNLDGIIMHNAQYDLGWLLALGIPITDIKTYDTKIIAKLYDNTLLNYSLDPLSKIFLPLAQQKSKFNLADVVRKHKLIKMKETCKTYETAALKYAYQNMNLIQEKDLAAMARYAILDVIATANLFLVFTKKISLDMAQYWSHFQLICTTIRAEGIPINMVSLNESIDKMIPIVDQLKFKVTSLAGKDLNVNSPKQLMEVLNISSTAKDKLKELNSPLANAILEYREAEKLLNTFLIKIRDSQIFSCPEAAAGGEIGMIYPQMNLLGAITGRFSSSTPNIQQIPKNSKTYGNICREIFIAPDDKEWVSLDWSNQEGRLAAHFAKVIGAPGAQEFVEKWVNDPHMDQHSYTAELIWKDKFLKIEAADRKNSLMRKHAKAINLGLIYSKGGASLCEELGLPTKTAKTQYGMRKVAGDEGQALLETYHKYNPWLKTLNTAVKDALDTRGYIKTISGRCYRSTDKRFNYKALNAEVQGSASDQMYWALRQAYDAGVKIISIVHDEFNVAGINDGLKMKKIMETNEIYGVKLEVPMVVDMSVGTSWGTLNEYNEIHNRVATD